MAKFPHKNADFALKSLVLYKEQLLTHLEVAEGFCACILLAVKPLKNKYLWVLFTLHTWFRKLYTQCRERSLAIQSTQLRLLL